MTAKDLQRLISLTFDENPEIRKKAAKKLSDLNDPGALFALLELTYDKDQSVKETARKLLGNKQKEETEELMSFSEIFAARPKKTEIEEEVPMDKKRRLLYPIEKLFEKHMGKDRAEMVKNKMMPSLERVYLKATEGKKKSISDSDRKEAMQEFLTSYLDAISDVPSREEPDGRIEIDSAVDSLESLDHVSSKLSLDGDKADLIMDEADDFTDEFNEAKEHEKFLEHVPDSMFKKAYEIMMFSGGDTKLMKKEMKRMLRNAERDIKMAFILAKEKFKENKITKLTEIREKMRNITTDDLIITSKDLIEFKKPRSSMFALRLLVQDPQGNEGVLYLFNGRGQNLNPNMKIKLVKAYAKIINDETALTIGSKGNIYIVV